MKNRVTVGWARASGAMVCSVLMVACSTQRKDDPGASLRSTPGSDGPAVASPGVVAREQANPGAEAQDGQARGRISQMDIGSLFQLREEGRVFLVDVRPAFFHALNHIPGSISLPLKKLDAQLPGMQPQLDAALSEGKVIVLYCTDENCPDGRRAATRLAKLGYSVSVYKGGWKEWKESGL